MTFPFLPSRLLASLCFALSAGALVAQPPSAADGFGVDYDLGYSYSSKADVGATGEVAVHAARLKATQAFALDDAGRGLTVGLEWNRYGFDVSGVTAIPDQLQSLALVAGLNYPLNQQWTLGATIAPGIYSDFEHVTSDDFNAPAILTVRYVQSRELVWVFGTVINFFSDTPVIPIVGVRWQFAPQWTFSLGLPTTGVTYQASDALALRAGLSIQGGSFHVTHPPASGLRNTLVDYREVRVGIGAAYNLSATLSLNAEAGIVTDRRFHYFDKDRGVNGDPAGYFTLSISGKF